MANLWFVLLVAIMATATLLVFNIMTREQYAFQVLRLMIAHDWKFDVTIKDWDQQAVERAFSIADKFIRESEITNV
jgi:hypothetical protein